MDVKVLLSHRCFLLYTIYLTIILQNFVFTCTKHNVLTILFMHACVITAHLLHLTNNCKRQHNTVLLMKGTVPSLTVSDFMISVNHR
jgi:hypothetical protein